MRVRQMRTEVDEENQILIQLKKGVQDHRLKDCLTWESNSVGGYLQRLMQTEMLWSVAKGVDRELLGQIPRPSQDDALSLQFSSSCGQSDLDDAGMEEVPGWKLAIQ